jgi:trk system potassium uptake protein TrkA
VHIVIMGCGRTGAALASEFESRGHSVAIIDRLGDAFRRLPADFQGQRITGIGFDRDTLVSAGVEDAYAFAAVSSGDNSNILAARVVRETYGVENVVARISDPGRAEVYDRLGIRTVAPVPWTSSQIVAHLLPGGTHAKFSDEAAGITLRSVAFNDGWLGRTVEDIEAATGARVAYLQRFGTGVVPAVGTLLQAGDGLHMIIPSDATDAMTRVLSRPPGVRK